MRSTLLLFIFLFLTSIAFAQSDTIPGNPPSGYVGSGSNGMNFDGHDFFFSFDGGVQFPRYEAGIQLGFDFRPFYNKVLVEQQPDLLYQYHEKKFLFWLGIEKRYLPIKLNTLKFGIFASLNGGYVFGNYRGVRENPAAAWVFMPRAGLVMKIENSTYLRLGYGYFNTQTDEVPKYRAYINITYLFQ